MQEKNGKWVSYAVQKEIHRSILLGSGRQKQQPWVGRWQLLHAPCLQNTIPTSNPASQHAAFYPLNYRSCAHSTFPITIAARAPWGQLLSQFHPPAHAELSVLVHAAQHALVLPAWSTLSNTLPTFTPWRSLLGSAGGTTASFVLTMGTMFIRRSSWSVPLRFRRFCSSWKSKLVTKI
jgi:hypothetical protein